MRCRWSEGRSRARRRGRESIEVPYGAMEKRVVGLGEVLSNLYRSGPVSAMRRQTSPTSRRSWAIRGLWPVGSAKIREGWTP